MKTKKTILALMNSFAKKHGLSEKAKNDLKKLCTKAYAEGSNSVLNLFD